VKFQIWREVLGPYKVAVEELVIKLQHIRAEYQDRGMYSPIEYVQGRVKSVTSLLEKAERKSIAVEDITDKIDDIAGIRVVCQFVEDIDHVVELISKRSDIQILEQNDYIRNVKESGYRSYHLVVSYGVNTIDSLQTVKVEIQIRTLAMNFWAVIEHSLQYKYRDMPEHISKRLTASANAILLLDNEMSSIREEVMVAQRVFRQRSNVVDDILNTIQNLYKVLPSFEISELQQEFYKLYHNGEPKTLIAFSRRLEKLAKDNGI